MAIQNPTARLSALAAAALLAAGHAQAQNNNATTTLAETVVTATRTETRADQLISDVTVITREQIEQSAGRTLPELLQQYAGAQIAANGGRGKVSSVSLRGADSRHTLMLIDGVRYGSVSAGTPVWANIPLVSIERIEVLQGPASSLYGSDALGGVVQVFTRGVTQDGVHPYAELTLGSHAYRQTAAGVSGAAGTVRYGLGVNALNDHGFSATNSRAPNGVYNPDSDGFRQRSVNGYMDWSFVPDWTLSASFLHSQGTNYFDDGIFSAPGPGLGDHARGKLSTDVANLGVSGKILPHWRTRVTYSQSRDKDDVVAAANSWTLGRFVTRQDQWTWQNDVDTPLGVIVAGVEHLEQRLDSSTEYSGTKRSVNSVFTGLNGQAGRHSWQLSLRRDRNSQYGGQTTGSAGYGFKLTEALRVNASLGTAFVAPSFNYLYYPYLSNPDLKPERSRSGELGVTWTVAAGHEATLRYYQTRVRDYIANDGNYVPQNIQKAKITGWSLGYQALLGGWTVQTKADFLDPRNETLDKQLQHRARRQLTLDANHRVGSWTLGASLLTAAHRFDNAANTQRLGGYTTADLYATYALARDWTLQARLNNLANKDYETAYGYNQPGREVYVTLRWQPK